MPPTCPSPKRADLIAARPLCHGSLGVQNCWHACQSVSYCLQVCRDAGCCGRGKDRVSYLNQRSKRPWFLLWCSFNKRPTK